MWSDDTKTTQTIQWRTSTTTEKGVVAFQKKTLYNRFNPAPLRSVPAITQRPVTPWLLNDPVEIIARG